MEGGRKQSSAILFSPGLPTFGTELCFRYQIYRVSKCTREGTLTVRIVPYAVCEVAMSCGPFSLNFNLWLRRVERWEGTKGPQMWSTVLPDCSCPIGIIEKARILMRLRKQPLSMPPYAHWRVNVPLAEFQYFVALAISFTKCQWHASNLLLPFDDFYLGLFLVPKSSALNQASKSSMNSKCNCINFLVTLRMITWYSMMILDDIAKLVSFTWWHGRRPADTRWKTVWRIKMRGGILRIERWHTKNREVAYS